MVTSCPLWLYCGSAPVRLSLRPFVEFCRERLRGFSVVYSREVYSLEVWSRDDLCSRADRECWRAMMFVFVCRAENGSVVAQAIRAVGQRWSVSGRAQQVHPAQLRTVNQSSDVGHSKTIYIKDGLASQTCLDRGSGGSSWRWTFDSLLLNRQSTNRGLYRWHLSIRARCCLIGAGEHSLADVYSPNVARPAALCHYACSISDSPSRSIRCRASSTLR